MSDHLSTVFTLKLIRQLTNKSQNFPANAITVKKILTNLEILCTTEIEMTLKKLKIPRKHINNFLRSLLTFMTSLSKKPKLKLNSRAIRSLGLLNRGGFMGGGAGGACPPFFCNHFEELQIVLFEVELIFDNKT